MATKKQLDALKKARAAKAKTSKLNGTKKEWKKTNYPIFHDYKVIVGDKIMKVFGTEKEAKQYAEKFEHNDISITHYTTHNYIRIKK